MFPIFDIRDYGADPEGKADSSKAILAVLAAIRAAGGGTALVPPGTFRTGPMELSDNATLRLEKGATLVFDDDPERYPPVPTRWEGVACWAMHPLVFARDARNVRIEGEGAVDGNGSSWWEALRRKKRENQAGPVTEVEKRLASLNGNLGDRPSGGGGRGTQFLRPPLVQFLSCEKVAVSGVAFRNSPFWTLHFLFSSDVAIECVRIENPADAPNTDGIDVDSCEGVSIADCEVGVGDDCVAIKAGSEPRDAAGNRPSRNVTISGCAFLGGHGGVVIGSETAGGIEDVEVRDCRFTGTDRGIRIKSRRGRGGEIRNLSFGDLVMEDVLAPLTVNLYYECGAKPEEAAVLFSTLPEPVSPLTPRVKDIRVANLVAEGCRASAGFIVGLPESRIENLSLQNCEISLARENLVPSGRSEMCSGIGETGERGLRLRNVSCSLRDVRVENRGGAGLFVEEGCDIVER